MILLRFSFWAESSSAPDISNWGWFVCLVAKVYSSPFKPKMGCGYHIILLLDLWKQPETKSNFATENQTWLQDEKCPFRAFRRLFSGVNSLFLFSGSCNLGGFNYFLCSSWNLGKWFNLTSIFFKPLFILVYIYISSSTTVYINSLKRLYIVSMWVATKTTKWAMKKGPLVV